MTVSLSSSSHGYSSTFLVLILIFMASLCVVNAEVTNSTISQDYAINILKSIGSNTNITIVNDNTAQSLRIRVFSSLAALDAFSAPFSGLQLAFPASFSSQMYKSQPQLAAADPATTKVGLIVINDASSRTNDTAPMTGSNLVTLSLYSLKYVDSNFQQVQSVSPISVKDLSSDPIQFSLQVTNVGQNDISTSDNIERVKCNYYDERYSVWLNDGLTTLSVNTVNETQELRCATTHFTRFGIAVEPPFVPHWATLYYATISFGIGCICLVLFLVIDAVCLFGVWFLRHLMWGPGLIDDEYIERKKPSIVLVTLGRLIYDVLSRHMWLSIPTTLVLGVAGKESLLTKYQRLAIWWVSVASYAIGTVGIVGSLRVYWNWQGQTGQGDLLGRDLYTLLASYWAPVLVTSLVAGKGVHLLASYVFQRFSGEFKLVLIQRYNHDYNDRDKSLSLALRVLRKLTIEPIVRSLSVAYAAHLVLYGVCGLFLTGMYIVMIIIGLRFLEI